MQAKTSVRMKFVAVNPKLVTDLSMREKTAVLRQSFLHGWKAQWRVVPHKY